MANIIMEKLNFKLKSGSVYYQEQRTRNGSHIKGISIKEQASVRDVGTIFRSWISKKIPTDLFIESTDSTDGLMF